MAVYESGTRQWANIQQGVKTSSRHFDRGYTRDVGMSKLVTGALVFSSSPPRVTFAGMGVFGFNDTVVVEGTASNNGEFAITAVNAGYLQLDPPPTPETAPATATIRVG